MVSWICRPGRVINWFCDRVQWDSRFVASGLRAGVWLRRAPGRVKGRGGAGVPGQGAHGCQGAATAQCLSRAPLCQQAYTKAKRRVEV